MEWEPRGEMKPTVDELKPVVVASRTDSPATCGRVARLYEVLPDRPPCYSRSRGRLGLFVFSLGKRIGAEVSPRFGSNVGVKGARDALHMREPVPRCFPVPRRDFNAAWVEALRFDLA